MQQFFKKNFFSTVSHEAVYNEDSEEENFGSSDEENISMLSLNYDSADNVNIFFYSVNIVKVVFLL